MSKPLVAANFFSFPRLLLWSLPLGFLAISTWLLRGPDTNLANSFGRLLQQSEEAIVSKV